MFLKFSNDIPARNTSQLIKVQSKHEKLERTDILSTCERHCWLRIFQNQDIVKQVGDEDVRRLRDNFVVLVAVAHTCEVSRLHEQFVSIWIVLPCSAILPDENLKLT